MSIKAHMNLNVNLNTNLSTNPNSNSLKKKSVHTVLQLWTHHCSPHPQFHTILLCVYNHDESPIVQSLYILIIKSSEDYRLARQFKVCSPLLASESCQLTTICWYTTAWIPVTPWQLPHPARRAAKVQSTLTTHNIWPGNAWKHRYVVTKYHCLVSNHIKCLMELKFDSMDVRLEPSTILSNMIFSSHGSRPHHTTRWCRIMDHQKRLASIIQHKETKESGWIFKRQQILIVVNQH